jgi:hypothetical protein
MMDATMPKTYRAFLTGAAAVLAALAVAPSSASAQEDARWLPWIGCWESADPYADESMICVRPVAGGAEMLSLLEGEVVSREILTADGRPSAVDMEGCTGSRTARFSEDARRLFTTSELTCEGEFDRSGRGLMALTSPASWIDVQVVDAGGRDMAWVQHYRPAAPDRVEAAGMSGLATGREMAVRTARRAAAAAVDLADVVEASREVGNEAAKAWISETGDPFDLDGETLVELADAGVAPDVIDVMVAVSYPEHFVVNQEDARPERLADEGGYDPYAHRVRLGVYSYWGSPFFYDPFYSPYRYGYGYGYGYPYGGSWGYGYRPTVVVVSPTGQSDQGRGRFVRGQGYTRSGSGSSGSRPAVRTGGGSRPSASAGSRSRGSSGSRGTSTGRTAKRRGGGGGGGFFP